MQKLSEIKDENVVSLYPGFFLTDEGRDSLSQLVRSLGHKEAPPLDDNSGYVPDTRQLKYLEGYLVVEALENTDLFNLAFVKGLDLNSIPEMLYLGMVYVNSIRGYDFPVSRQIWPRLRDSLKISGDLDGAVRSLLQSNPQSKHLEL